VAFLPYHLSLPTFAMLLSTALCIFYLALLRPSMALPFDAGDIEFHDQNDFNGLTNVWVPDPGQSGKGGGACKRSSEGQQGHVLTALTVSWLSTQMLLKRLRNLQ
jgi:hypothetical protein